MRLFNAKTIFFQTKLRKCIELFKAISVAIKKKGDFLCGTLSKWHLKILFRIQKKKDFIIVALNQWVLRWQEWGAAGRKGGGGGYIKGL